MAVGHNILQQNKRVESIRKRKRIYSDYTDFSPWELTNRYSLSFLVNIVIIVVVVIMNFIFIVNVIANVASRLRFFYAFTKLTSS